MQALNVGICYNAVASPIWTYLMHLDCNFQRESGRAYSLCTVCDVLFI